MPFDFVVRVLNALEQREKSIYLLGGSRKSLQTAERNVRHTFPDLRIVGRCAGGFKRQEEATVIEAIKKASPSLLLVSKGVNGDERWIAHNIANFNPGIQVWCSDLFDIFAERRHRPSRFLFDRGLEWIGFCFRNPLLIFRFFPYLRYKLLLLWYRIFRR
jgi:N-acetylglucosaminyldiphosphoundecaprenol N-acetyl-beta-D-mannosaminyltransferase